jgi:hypothetical protein
MGKQGYKMPLRSEQKELFATGDVSEELSTWPKSVATLTTGVVTLKTQYQPRKLKPLKRKIQACAHCSG